LTQENQAIELTSNEMIESSVNYIHQNRVKGACVELEHEYIYSSAKKIARQLVFLEIDEL
jgi:hypothetical protein